MPSSSLLFAGCPMWHMDAWSGSIFPAATPSAQSLYHYSRLFNSVEGNTSFYQIPDEANLRRWQQSVPERFKFCFKFHQSISHHQLLQDVEQQTLDFLARFRPMATQIGCLMLQLPAHFGPRYLPRLQHFLQRLPDDFVYAVEVRHPAFFAKGDEERQFNRLLLDNGVNRVIMDTRGLFSAKGNKGLLGEVKMKKPRVPVNVIATGAHPVVRFVGHPDILANRRFYQSWHSKLQQWLDEGRTPFVFFHLADNSDAPWLAEQFFQDWPNKNSPFTVNLPRQASQSSLF
ncbi:DUF72 domain-containing protein [Bowmanella yangjiangensis]|uniref:DUF72 domain-containing protein n=1 Tax=Bowmanella yangjiangensis TaxID=2811230 RepID=A0ABS3CPP9_9ALTE|nr:DUF72 domain-containing protein [Bowmanella yangjiangensis]MBN7819082.1 DUF72 domain-containing protein [Bowmanella yangjiangensis]